MKLSASIRAGTTGLPSRAALAAALVATQGIPMTVPNKYRAYPVNAHKF